LLSVYGQKHCYLKEIIQAIFGNIIRNKSNRYIMKLPKTLLQSIMVGVTAGTMASCSLDLLVSPIENIKCEILDNNKDDGGFNCPACGLG
jgi:hypothetical protein